VLVNVVMKHLQHTTELFTTQSCGICIIEYDFAPMYRYVVTFASTDMLKQVQHVHIPYINKGCNTIFTSMCDHIYINITM
jgi:hypothetical protein